MCIPRLLLYGALLATFPAEALAWGLQTHVYFSQGILLALPLLDPALRRAVQRFPRLLLAGACLPDLALLGRPLGTAAFRGTHGWPTLRAATNGTMPKRLTPDATRRPTPRASMDMARAGGLC